MYYLFWVTVLWSQFTLKIIFCAPSRGRIEDLFLFSVHCHITCILLQVSVEWCEAILLSWSAAEAYKLLPALTSRDSKELSINLKAIVPTLLCLLMFKAQSCVIFAVLSLVMWTLWSPHYILCVNFCASFSSLPSSFVNRHHANVLSLPFTIVI